VPDPSIQRSPPRSRPRRTAACLAVALAAGVACAADESAEHSARPHWGFELKRQNTGRGTPEESTKTTLRLENYPDGELALVRLDVPLPDAKTDFAGSPFDPRLGDIKVRLVARTREWGGMPWSPRTELTLPTAHPQSLGGGKVQLMLGVRTFGRLQWLDLGERHVTWAVLLQQTASIAGDPAAKDVNNTKFELEALSAWRSGYTLKFTLKPTIDWVMDGQAGAVVELEGGVALPDGWRMLLMGGVRAWGPCGG
jgi:hypothetical protein